MSGLKEFIPELQALGLDHVEIIEYNRCDVISFEHAGRNYIFEVFSADDCVSGRIEIIEERTIFKTDSLEMNPTLDFIRKKILLKRPAQIVRTEQGRRTKQRGNEIGSFVIKQEGEPSVEGSRDIYFISFSTSYDDEKPCTTWGYKSQAKRFATFAEADAARTIAIQLGFVERGDAEIVNLNMPARKKGGK